MDIEDQTLIPLLLSIFAAAAVWFGVRSLSPTDQLARVRLAALSGTSLRGGSPGGRLPLQSLLVLVGSRLPANRAAVTQALSAGGFAGAAPEILVGFQGLAAAAGLMLGMTMGPLAILIAPSLALAGYRLPWLYLSMRARSRHDEVSAALPDAVDLLVVCMQGGLNLSLSLQRVASNTSGLLGKELSRTVEEIDLGVPLTTALVALGDRNPSEDMGALVGTLVNADRFGGRAASSLETLAGEIRRVRRRKAEEQARRAPVKILFPMVFLILPAFLVLTVIPVVLGTLRNIGF
ncbi:MAG: type II secretion system F family protein [Actinomycetota bacterium]